VIANRRPSSFAAPAAKTAVTSRRGDESAERAHRIAD